MTKKDSSTNETSKLPEEEKFQVFEFEDQFDDSVYENEKLSFKKFEQKLNNSLKINKSTTDTNLESQKDIKINSISNIQSPVIKENNSNQNKNNSLNKRNNLLRSSTRSNVKKKIRLSHSKVLNNNHAINCGNSNGTETSSSCSSSSCIGDIDMKDTINCLNSNLNEKVLYNMKNFERDNDNDESADENLRNCEEKDFYCGNSEIEDKFLKTGRNNWTSNTKYEKIYS